nr:MAG TPA: hypothetical protein [Caudoviricetes sp.]
MTRRDFFFMRFGGMAKSKPFNHPASAVGGSGERRMATPGLGSSAAKTKPTDHGEVKGRDRLTQFKDFRR